MFKTKIHFVDVMTLAREAEIRALGLMEQEVPDALEHLVRAAVRVTGAESARVNIITGTEQRSLVSTDGDTASHPIEDSFCARVVRGPDRQLVVPDATKDERFDSSPFVTSGHVSSYSANQLVTRRGVPIGTLCVYSPDPRDISDDAMETLSYLAASVMEVLESNRQREALHEVVNELADGSRELRRSNEHLAAFAGQVSHDVQGPLASVLMALQLMEEEGDPDGFLLSTALSGAQRMRATIAGLMDFAVVGGRLVQTHVDMNAAVEDVLVDLQTRLGTAEVVVSDLPSVWGDEVQVRAVTQNLVANALKYAGPTPHIRVEGQHLAGATRITVTDDGPGVPESQREAIFGLQVRGEGVELTGVDGLGIGLATCRRIIDAHGGSIGVQDGPGGGARFWFELPDCSIG
jgi:signal transduction histidine kinase